MSELINELDQVDLTSEIILPRRKVGLIPLDLVEVCYLSDKSDSWVNEYVTLFSDLVPMDEVATDPSAPVPTVFTHALDNKEGIYEERWSILKPSTRGYKQAANIVRTDGLYFGSAHLFFRHFPGIVETVKTDSIQPLPQILIIIMQKDLLSLKRFSSTGRRRK